MHHKISSRFFISIYNYERDICLGSYGLTACSQTGSEPTDSNYAFSNPGVE